MTDFHIARFGNKANAHDVLGHSGIPKEVLTTMVWRTDTPPNSEGLSLEPFVAAYRSGDYYVLHATAIDADAPRAGMVVTTAAVVPLVDLAALDICALWVTLAQGVEVDQPLNSADFLLDPIFPSHAHPAGAEAAASGLFESKRVVWIGPGFEDFVGCLWLHLGPQNRGRLVVAAAGHPDRIPIPSEDSSLTVVKSGASAIGRWFEWSTASQSSVEMADPVRDALFGDDEGRAEQLADSLDLVSGEVDLSLWRHLANAAKLFQNLSDLDHQQARALLQLLGLVQPDAQAGVVVKRQALDRLLELTEQASFADIRGLRGLPWASLEAGIRRSLVEAWAEVVTVDPSHTDDVLEAGAEVADTSDELMVEVGAALAARVPEEDVARLSGAALASELGPAFLTWLVAKVGATCAVDEAVSAALKTGADAPDWLAETANALRLPLTLAASTPVTDPVVAWTMQIALHSPSVKAEDLLEKRTGPLGVVLAALALKDGGLLERASKAVAADGTLLSSGSVEDDAFRSLWFAAAKAGADPWASARPSDAVGTLLDLLLADEFVESVVLTSLSQTTAADISAHVSRKDLWSKFPPDALNGFRDATAQSMARSFQRGDAALEHQLAAAVLAAPLLAAVAEESAGQALTLLAGISAARASDAVVVATHGRFSRAESTSLGGLVKKRHWRSAAEVIITLSASRADLVNAATVVSGMFGFFDRLAQIITSGSPVRPTFSTNELRSNVTAVAASLYKSGPMADALWERAGGDAADLATGLTTGRLAWGQAVEASLAGRRGAPTLTELVTVMLEDFPKNPALLALKQIIENGTAS